MNDVQILITLPNTAGAYQYYSHDQSRMIPVSDRSFIPIPGGKISQSSWAETANAQSPLSLSQTLGTSSSQWLSLQEFR